MFDEAAGGDPTCRGPLRAEAEVLEAGGCSPPLRSVSLPDHIEDLDHLLVDDENDGNIQADAAQARDRSFVEARD